MALRVPGLGGSSPSRGGYDVPVIVAQFSERTTGEALRVGPALVDVARRELVPAFAASLIEGPAVLLGLHQRAERVLEGAACRAGGVAIFRRATSGTAAFVGRRALVFSLALPGVAALFPDASPRTLLNRNVRPLLRGLSAAGALAHYFGREVVSVRKRPAVLLGFDVGEDGAVLVEAIAGLEEPFALPAALASEDERALDRFAGRAPLALAEVLSAGTTPEWVARCVAEAFAARGSSAVTAVGALSGLLAPDPLASGSRSPDSADLLPAGAVLLDPVRIPIGWLERVSVPGAGLWLGGDVLAPRFVLDRLAAVAGGHGHTDDLDALPIDGVSVRELLEKLPKLAATE